MEALTLWFLHFVDRDTKDRLLYLMALEWFWAYFKRSFPEVIFLYESFTVQSKIKLTFQIRNL